MKKKIAIISFVIILIIFFSFYFKSFIIKESSFCPFCDEKVINYQKYYEDENILGLYCYKPLFKGHCLIVPKRHVERLEDLDISEVDKIFYLIKKTHRVAQELFDVKSYLILQKNGKEVGQSVAHLHFHYIPNKRNGSNYSFLFKILMNPFIKKLKEKEMQEVTKLISQNI